MKGGDNVNTTLKKIVAAITTLSIAFTLASPALLVSQVSAQEDPFKLGEVQGELNLPGDSTLDETALRDVIVRIVKILLGFLGLIAVIIIIYAGFIWMTAAGNEEKVSTARATLTAGLIGLIIIIAAYALTSFVVNIIYNIIGSESPTAP